MEFRVDSVAFNAAQLDEEVGEGRIVGDELYNGLSCASCWTFSTCQVYPSRPSARKYGAGIPAPSAAIAHPGVFHPENLDALRQLGGAAVDDFADEESVAHEVGRLIKPAVQPR